MIEERYARVKELFLAAAELPSADRRAFLDEACGGDQRLRGEVDSLLRFHDDDPGWEEAEAMPGPSLAPGESLTHYTIVRRLGAGGMGEVYEAQDRKLERHVAIKLLHPWVAGDRRMRARFRREARAASALSHPNICTVHDIDEADGRLFLVMELLEGRPLAARLAGRALPVEELLALGLQIGTALEAAHAAGIVHRDVKPGNIFLDRRGRVKLLDFGLALRGAEAERLTTQRGLIGTVAYMSPEQARGEELDARSDIFSFGVVLYEMATGQLPFGGNGSAWRQLADLAEQTPITPRHLNPDLPAVLDRVIRRALAKEPAGRYPTATALLADLRRLQAGRRSSDIATALLPEPVAGGDRSSPLPVRERTPFVGRAGERRELGFHLRQAAGGRGSVVFVSGEAGVGKTRLVSELTGEARRLEMQVLAGCCREMEGTPPFLPFAEVLESLARSVPEETLGEIFGVAGSCALKIAPRLGRWLSSAPAAVELPPEQERLQLFNCFLDVLDRTARRCPLLVILEDLHWADSSTILLLRHLGPRLSGLPVLVVGTFRDFEVGLDHPLAAALEELLAKRLAHRMALGLLGQGAVRTILSALGGQPAPSGISRRIYGVTEGNPFFVEEVFDHLAEEELLFDARGRWRRDVPVERLAVPDTVGLLLGRRLERLGETSQQVLAAAAVIGRRFSFELLEELLAMAPAELLDALEEGERTRLIESRRRGSEIRFSFAHALIRKTLLGRTSLLRQQLLHLQVATVLEEHLGETPGASLAELAYHLEQAGSLADAGKTVHYLELALRQALAAAAFEDALRLQRQAVQTLRSLPETPERIQHELRLEMDAVAPLSAVEGYSSESAERLFAKLEQLSRAAGSEVPHALAVSICRFSTVRGKIRTSRELAEQIVAGAERTGHPLRLLDGYRSLGCSLYFMGQPVAARCHLERACALFREDPAAYRPDPGLEDPLVYLTSHLGWTQWFLGLADQALATTEEGVRVARELEHPFSLAHALLFLDYVCQCRRDTAATREHAEEMLALAREHGYPMFVAAAEAAIGWARSATGDAVGGVADLRRGLDRWRETGAGVAVPFYRILLAEALGRAGHTEEALASLDRAHAQINADGERMFEAELFRLRGELLQEMSAPTAAARRALEERAESFLKSAVETAQAQGARALELRAAASWLSFQLDRDGEAAARAALAQLCEELGEGRETRDYRAARELLG